MSGQKPKPVKAPRRPGRKPAFYHGIPLAKLSVPTQFTDEQIEKAVKEAIAKHHDAFARGK